MILVRKLIDEQKYLYTHISYMKDEGNAPILLQNVDVIHLIFAMGQPLKEVQLSIRFDNIYVDILAFPHPVIVKPDCVSHTIRFLNFVNNYLKTWNGRFYLDEEFLDIAYSARIPYYLLEVYPSNSISAGVTEPIDFYKDIQHSLFGVAQGIITSTTAILNMKVLWQG